MVYWCKQCDLVVTEHRFICYVIGCLLLGSQAVCVR
jgi:predicted RNA-binding protein with PUA domain